MSPTNKQNLARVSAESAVHVAAAAASCEETANDIRQSREALRRSLDLLASSYHQVEKSDASADARADEDRSAA